MEYKLKNGKSIIIRKPVIDDAAYIVSIISAADSETKFLARNPGEFNITVEQEEEFITKILKDDDLDLYVAEYEGKVIGNCSVGLVGKNERFRHRAEVSFVILKDFWGMGIGTILMQHCIDWCKNKGLTQIELDVVAENTQAINLYKKFGFKEMGTKPKAMRYPDGSYADEKFMVLEL